MTPPRYNGKQDVYDIVAYAAIIATVFFSFYALAWVVTHL